jgi:predicted alpha/beta superfamily hydrolase
MKCISLAFLLFSLHAVSQTGKDISIGKKDSIYSKLLHEKREIWIHLPGSANSPLFKSQRYPVVYLLDGDAHFYSVAGMIHQLSEINGNTLYPEMIVVGIPNTDRTRDLTPTHSPTGYTGDSTGVGSSGGGEIFMSFIEKELMPYVDSLYPTAPYKVFIGHSLGGLTVINALMHHTRMFNSYIAIDPSMWWHDQLLLKQSGNILTQNNFNGKTLFLGIANTMPPGMDTVRVWNDKTNNTIHIRSILLLANELKKSRGDGLRWEYKYYPDDNHGSVPLISEYDGLKYIFDFYNFKNSNSLFDTSYSSAILVKMVTEHYQKISQSMGYEVLPQESFINNLGYGFLQNKMFEKAFVFFNMNISNYPKSFNVYDSMGDYYAAKKDNLKAAEYFSKALALNENPDTRKKLEEMKTANLK